VAKTQRIAIPPLPLSERFYGVLLELGKRMGLPVADPSKLSAAVAALSHTYTRERGELLRGNLGDQAPLARLGFFLPRDAIKMFGPLGELTAAGYFRDRKVLRVLDLGAGLGSSTLGLARYLRFAELPVERLEVTAIERDPASTRLMGGLVDALKTLPAELVPVALDVRAADLHDLSEPGPFDVILLGFVLNELFLERTAAERPALRAGLLDLLARKLRPNGAMIVLEPALKQSARELMATRDALPRDELHVFAPCVRSGPCPMLEGERDWCHEALDYALPPHLVDVARRAGLRYQGLSYAALVLTKKPRAQHAPHDTLYRIVSDPLLSKGKRELFGCGERGYQRLTRLDRDASADNRGFDLLRRGDLVALPTLRVERATSVPSPTRKA